MHNKYCRYVQTRITVTKVIFFFACIFALASCGGGNSSSTSSVSVITVEEINGITVPPLPDPKQNAATVAGIDSNSNGVRDDVERVAAKEFGLNVTKYKFAIEHAKSEQTLITQKNASAISEYINSVACNPLSAKELDILTMIQLNTVDRRKIYAGLLAGKSMGACSR